jgi:hypothetical protein
MKNLKPAHNPEGKYCDCAQIPGLHEVQEGDCIYKGMEGGVTKEEEEYMGELTSDWKGWLLWNIESSMTEKVPEGCQDGVLHINFKQGENERVSISCPAKE